MCNPLWSNVFGCRTSDDPSVVAGEAESYSADETQEIDGMQIEPETSVAWGSLAVAGALGAGLALLMR